MKLSPLSRSEQEDCSCLPDKVVTSFSTAPLIRMYRELQLDCLVKPVAPQLPASGMVVSDPVLTVFPHVLDDPLSLEALKYLWQVELCLLPPFNPQRKGLME